MVAGLRGGCSANAALFLAHVTTGVIMSGINGDKARFHRGRKQKIARRGRNRDLFKSSAMEVKTANARPAPSKKPVSA